MKRFNRKEYQVELTIFSFEKMAVSKKKIKVDRKNGFYSCVAAKDNHTMNEWPERKAQKKLWF